MNSKVCEIHENFWRKKTNDEHIVQKSTEQERERGKKREWDRRPRKTKTHQKEILTTKIVEITMSSVRNEGVWPQHIRTRSFIVYILFWFESSGVWLLLLVLFCFVHNFFVAFVISCMLLFFFPCASTLSVCVISRARKAIPIIYYEYCGSLRYFSCHYCCWFFFSLIILKSIEHATEKN